MKKGFGFCLNLFVFNKKNSWLRLSSNETIINSLMKEKYDLLKALLPELEAYEQTTEKPSKAGFLAWLQGLPTDAAPPPQVSPVHHEVTGASRIASTLAMLAKYTRTYMKKSLAAFPFASPDDWVYLIVLFYHGPLNKTELILRSATEIPSGMDALRRLERQGMLRTLPFETDRRAVLVELTPEGAQMALKTMGPMKEVSALIAGNLTDEEAEELARILEKLYVYHEPLWRERIKKS